MESKYKMAALVTAMTVLSGALVYMFANWEDFNKGNSREESINNQIASYEQQINDLEMKKQELERIVDELVEKREAEHAKTYSYQR